MQTISFSDARAQLAATMDRVVEDHAPVIITRPGAPACVLIALEDWQPMDETQYLMSSPSNAARLNAAIRSLESGQGAVTHDVADLLGS